MWNKLQKSGFTTKAAIAVLDLLIVFACGAIALLARYELKIAAIPSQYFKIWAAYLPVECVLTVVIFALLKMYNFVWRIVGIHDVSRMFLSVLIAFLANALLGYFLFGRLPMSTYFIKLGLELICFIILRCIVRLVLDYQLRSKKKDDDERIMIVGAGDAGQMVFHEVENSRRMSGHVCCFVDDNTGKWGKIIQGVQIVGSCDRIPYYCKKYRITQIIIAMPSVSQSRQEEILNICNSTNCAVMRVPGIYQVINNEITLEKVRDVSTEDLLGRSSIQLDSTKLEAFLGGKTVMVTGGGGSIGSELCRQIAKHKPGMLIILDIYENNAYDIQQELKQHYGNSLNQQVEIASVRDKDKIYEIFERYHPDIVFHAAAHKHVPLMEHNPEEAIKNNVFGTYHVVRAAEKFGTQKFVMISTDKAVNPTNFMGATKRFCEMVLQSRYDSPTEYCCVRFGNVLGSNGSVVPLFKRQIEEGGPVTITDKRIIRYFMTIPEAAQLVLEAGAMAKQSQIFVLDMGEPVKILDLAENLIRLSGLEPYRDIEIKEIGLRPGEKLYEELLMASNDLVETANKKIFVEQQGNIDREEIMHNLELLDKALAEHQSPNELIQLMQRIVPTYKNPKQVNEAAVTDKIVMN